MAIMSFNGEYRFLSNFYPSPITWTATGLVYPTVEHLYQARKVDVDSPWHERIRTAPTPRDAKAIGQQAPIVENWDEMRIPVMRNALTYKFTSNDGLCSQLLATGHQLLVEGNTWHDQFWGSCVCPKHSGVEGWNALGILLMETRLCLHNIKYVDAQREKRK